ncbi:MAG TPA: glycosyltransferase [Solirubrobacteraceae bacterium]|jgi:glycosyltransferase involved in cell wall biosynthesis
MRVHVVDPSAYTPPYDHALCRALGEAGAEVELFTSRFAYGPVAPARGYERRELFYRAAGLIPEYVGTPSPAGRAARARRAVKLAEHVPDMLRYRRAARAADIVHFQWLTVQHLDGLLLPKRRLDGPMFLRRLPRARVRARAKGSVEHMSSPGGGSATPPRPPLVLTAHDVLPREPRRGQLAAQRRLYDRFDAVVVHSAHGRDRLTSELGVDPDRVHVIPHGVFSHLAHAPPHPPPFETDKPVVLCFGLMRPYKGIDVLLEAWRGIDDAELWVAGRPRMDISSLRASAPPNVRFVPRFITDEELPAYFRRADVVVLPYREIDQSGVLFTALAFAKPLLLTDVGGFPEVAAIGAARTVPAGDPDALRLALRELLDDPAALAAMAERSRAAAEGKYSWDSIARETLALYESLLGEHPGM